MPRDPLKSTLHRLLLRLPLPLFAELKARAQAVGLSVNSLIIDSLRTIKSVPNKITVTGAHAPLDLDKLQGLYEGKIRAVILFGSQARGEANQNSDIDLLLVLPPEVPISRSLYKLWDSHKVAPSNVSPQFCHSPNLRGIGSLWLEVAIDGIVLWEQNLEVSQTLIHVRQEILASVYTRKQAHGHYYWSTN